MKKLLILLFSALLIGILSACDDGGESESNESTTNEGASETSEMLGVEIIDIFEKE